jgi:hypothetical protein
MRCVLVVDGVRCEPELYLDVDLPIVPRVDDHIGGNHMLDVDSSRVHNVHLYLNGLILVYIDTDWCEDLEIWKEHGWRTGPCPYA